MPALNIYFPASRKRWTLRIAAQDFEIGRSKHCAVTIPHVSVSKRHVRVEFSGGRYRFRDLESRNGTFINDLRRETGPLSDGDVLRVGRFEITFYREEPPAGAPPAASGTEVLAAAAMTGERAESSDTLADVSSLPDDLPSDDSEVVKAVEVNDGNDGKDENDAKDERERKDGKEKQERITPSPVAESSDHTAGEAKASVVLRRSPAADKRSRRSPWPPAAVLAGAFLFVAVGILLGYLSAQFDSGDGNAGARNASGKPADSGDTTAPAAADSARESPLDEALYGEADWTDPDTATRVLVRLYMDLIGRPPTREEARQLLAMSAEDRWLTIVDESRRSGNTEPSSFEGGFMRLLGRPPKPDELASLRREAGEDLDAFLYLLARSRLYAAKGRQRRRSESQLALSLVTNLLSAPPSRAKRKASIDLLKQADGDLAQAVDALLKSAPESVAPVEDESTAGWIGDMFYLMLLRAPRTEELERHEELISQGDDGWKEVLRELALDEEYLMY